MADDVDVVVEELPFRQGDLFCWRDWPSNEPWSRFGVIITADCDFAQRKTQNQISYLPLLYLRDFVDLVWASQKLRQLKDQRTRDAIAFVHRHHLVLDSNAKPLSPDGLHRWIRTASADSICDGLSIADSKERRRFSEKHYRVLARLLIQSDSNTDGPALGTLCDVRAILNSDTTQKVLEQARNEMQNGLPHDCFFVSGVPGVPTASWLVAMLRHIRIIPESDLTASVAFFRDGPFRALRIGRLTSPYKFSLMQQFALLFTRIGLPVVHDDRFDNAVQATCDLLTAAMTRSSP